MSENYNTALIIGAGLSAVAALLWAAYALAGAGVVKPLPLLRLALVLITMVYLLRGLARFQNDAFKATRA